MSFFDDLERVSTRGLTENGANTYTTTLNKNLDVFAQAGAMRGRLKDVSKLFASAFFENKEVALRNLVHLRNIRLGGAGERDAFRAGVEVLIATQDVYLAQAFAEDLAYFGRWDDVVHMYYYAHVRKEHYQVGSKAHDEASYLKQAIGEFLHKVLLEDLENTENTESISLLAKWLPSLTSKRVIPLVTFPSSEHHMTWGDIGHMLRKDWGMMSPKQYRKTVKFLRNYLNIVETNLTNRTYDNIDLEKLPSRALYKYRKAFNREMEEDYHSLINAVNNGEKTLNASNVLPHEIVRDIYQFQGDPDELEATWKSLDNHVTSEDDVLVMADVSGSMSGEPMDVSIGLAIYTAERLKGAFHNKFMTFSAEPTMVRLKDEWSLEEKIQQTYSADWGMNTDLYKAMKLILDTAVENNTPKDKLPSKLVVISDMEYDDSQRVANSWFTRGESVTEWNGTLYEQLKEEFKANGYDIPTIIFWNVASRQNNLPVRKDELGVGLISGLTPALLQNVLGKTILDPEKMMMDTLYKEDYAFVDDTLVRAKQLERLKESTKSK